MTADPNAFQQMADFFGEVAALNQKYADAKLEAALWKAVAGNLGQALQLAAMEPELTPAYRQAMKDAYRNQLAVHFPAPPETR